MANNQGIGNDGTPGFYELQEVVRELKEGEVDPSKLPTNPYPILKPYEENSKDNNLFLNLK